MRRAAPWAVAALLFSSPAAAREGTLVAIDAGDLVLDIGQEANVQVGQVVELWRPVRLKHPVNGKVLVDRFKIATVKLVDVQRVLSLGKIEQASQRPPATGDVVVVPEDEPPSGPAPAPPPAAPGKPVVVVKADPETKELSDLFSSLEGSDPKKRAQAYRAWLAEHPNSRFSRVIGEEVQALDRAEKEAALVPPTYAPIERLRPGTPQRFAIELDPRYQGAIVHVRRRGAKSYRSIAMASVGARYWAATLPGDAIDEPAMDYFVEGIPKVGPPIALVGSAAEPREAEVDRRPLTGKREGTLATVALASEIASFNLKKPNDWVFQTEGAFGWRLGDGGIRAVRSGFGVLRGKGGSLDDLDRLNKPPRDVGLTYGWLETELGIGKNVGLIARPILGLRERGVTGGAQGFFRIGSDLATNLLLGGEALGTVGLRGVVQLEWRTIPRVPILLRSEVTNQPAGVGGDIGARAIAQVGWEIVPDLALSARASYQGRTINHAGPGAGAGVSYQW
ncbi:MAG: hypothetical protein KIT84_38830 [Labilithrix sp.]|nr:hypothetical protein [Labilithrix sp.]MCW5817017.1 hypothetical protein [Labilithrix sp.]